MNFAENKKYAERIELVLQYLKDQKITQKSISDKLNYTSLSKAKNPYKYPQNIIEKKTRKDVFENVLKYYGLRFDEEKEEIIKTGLKKDPGLAQDVMHYIMYYYSFFRKEVGMAWVRILDKKKVLIDYRIDEHWKGQFEVIESYTFISAEKRGITTPVKKLICLYSGTVKYGRPILLGTYSTVKRDGFPAAGKVLFQKVENKKSVLSTFSKEADLRIQQYLDKTVFTSEIITPNGLEDLGRI